MSEALYKHDSVGVLFWFYYVSCLVSIMRFDLFVEVLLRPDEGTYCKSLGT